MLSLIDWKDKVWILQVDYIVINYTKGDWSGTGCASCTAYDSLLFKKLTLCIAC